ncbi:radical SAM protein [Thioalkalivibrio denitrificans]|uniref:Radical SAM protein n=1 Tax=Thioalkalivibrio denitrificans TaxID=108003 RepID=A0A1V3NCB2_9GAMM|nr:radical SAM protein [Thioalkalivibrio denitrificans]OOG22498.1 radical SAM protein [Thioalkalivibrio denitrificans]
MSNWYDLVRHVEPLEDLTLDRELVQSLETDWSGLAGRDIPPVHFYTPTFKSYQTSELKDCGKSAWPAVSVTGGDCKLQCDHCKAKILEPMIPARTPEDLWREVNGLIEDGARGMLLTGGSNHRNEVEYDDYYSTIRRIKDEFPDFRIALHTALVNDDIARSMEQAGIDAAMMDVIGAQDTITQVYHLRRSVEDFEATLESLVRTDMKVVPHIVIGLHYGRLLGEWNALEMIRRHLPDAVVLVVVMPFYAPENRPFVNPDTGAVGGFFMDARKALPETPLLLGCARPPGMAKQQIDAYAVMAGLNGIAHPADGVVELAARLERRIRVTPACCSIAVGDEVMAVEGANAGIELDLDTILAEERKRRERSRVSASGLGGIRVVSQAGQPYA